MLWHWRGMGGRHYVTNIQAPTVTLVSGWLKIAIERHWGRCRHRLKWVRWKVKPAYIGGSASASHISVSSHRAVTLTEPCNPSSASCIIPAWPSITKYMMIAQRSLGQTYPQCWYLHCWNRKIFLYDFMPSLLAASKIFLTYSRTNLILSRFSKVLPS